MELEIKRSHLSSILDMAGRSEVEVCGFLFGKREKDSITVEEVCFVGNRLKSPVAFEMEPMEMVEAMEEAEKRGLEVVGIFHSHLKCPPRPSGRDLRGMELWPVVWFIVDNEGNYGAYLPEGGRVREVEVRVL